MAMRLVFGLLLGALATAAVARAADVPPAAAPSPLEITLELAPATPRPGDRVYWLGRLRKYLDARANPAAPLLLCGDFNVAPDDRDVHDPAIWAETVICHPEARTALGEPMGHKD